jgi:hypothetical protein
VPRHGAPPRNIVQGAAVQGNSDAASGKLSLPCGAAAGAQKCCRYMYSQQRFLARAASWRDGPRGAAPAGGAAGPPAWLRGGGANASGVCCVERVCTPSCLRAHGSSVPPTPDARFLRWRVSRVRAHARRRRARPSSWCARRRARRWASSLRCPKATASRCRRSCPASSTSTGARRGVPRAASLQQGRALPRADGRPARGAPSASAALAARAQVYPSHTLHGGAAHSRARCPLARL